MYNHNDQEMVFAKTIDRKTSKEHLSLLINTDGCIVAFLVVAGLALVGANIPHKMKIFLFINESQQKLNEMLVDEILNGSNMILLFHFVVDSNDSGHCRVRLLQCRSKVLFVGCLSIVNSADRRGGRRFFLF